MCLRSCIHGRSHKKKNLGHCYTEYLGPEKLAPEFVCMLYVCAYISVIIFYVYMGGLCVYVYENIICVCMDYVCMCL